MAMRLPRARLPNPLEPGKGGPIRLPALEEEGPPVSLTATVTATTAAASALTQP
jgi:hypothetical protein